MDDGVEELLQIDALGEAIGGDKKPLLGLAHRLDARAPFVAREARR